MSQVMISIDSPYYFYMHPCGLPHSSSPHQLSNRWKVSNWDSEIPVSQQLHHVERSKLHFPCKYLCMYVCMYVCSLYRVTKALLPLLCMEPPSPPACLCPRLPVCSSKGKTDLQVVLGKNLVVFPPLPFREPPFFFFH